MEKICYTYIYLYKQLRKGVIGIFSQMFNNTYNQKSCGIFSDWKWHLPWETVFKCPYTDHYNDTLLSCFSIAAVWGQSEHSIICLHPIFYNLNDFTDKSAFAFRRTRRQYIYIQTAPRAFPALRFSIKEKWAVIQIQQ